MKIVLAAVIGLIIGLALSATLAEARGYGNHSSPDCTYHPYQIDDGMRHRK